MSDNLKWYGDGVSSGNGNDGVSPWQAHLNEPEAGTMEYEIITVINRQSVAVRCYERSARVLLPLWAAQAPNDTECRELSGERRCIVCFDPENF